MLLAPTEFVLLAALVALVVDALVGEPIWLYRRLPHPVVALGRTVARLEARWWRAGDDAVARRRAGRRIVAVMLLLAAGLALPLTVALAQGWLAAAGVGVLASALLAQKSLVEHVEAVAVGLERGLDDGRAAVSRIVGRDPSALDAAGVARAAVESAAENVSDGVVAPLFWFLLLGPIGLLGYKTINTLDSMIGYRSQRYLDFGRAAARLDDRVNWAPARLCGLLLLALGGRPSALGRLMREARKHRSPNAGWPEAAVALVLDVALAGPRVYAAGVVDDAWIHAAGRAVAPADIRRATALLWRLWGLLVALVAIALAAVIG